MKGLRIITAISVILFAITVVLPVSSLATGHVDTSKIKDDTPKNMRGKSRKGIRPDTRPRLRVISDTAKVVVPEADSVVVDSVVVNAIEADTVAVQDVAVDSVANAENAVDTILRKKKAKEETVSGEDKTEHAALPFKAVLSSPRLKVTGTGTQAVYTATVNYNLTGEGTITLRFSCLWADDSPVQNAKLSSSSKWIDTRHNLVKEVEIELDGGNTTGSETVSLPGWMLPKVNFSSSIRIRIRAIGPNGRTLATVNTPVVSVSGQDSPF